MVDDCQNSPAWLESLRTLASKRRSPRMHVQVPVQLIWHDDKSERNERVLTITISWFGCAVHAQKFFRLGSRILLQNEKNGRVVDAKVVYCLEDYGAQVVEVGLEFDEDGRPFWEIPFVKQ